MPSTPKKVIQKPTKIHFKTKEGKKRYFKAVRTVEVTPKKRIVKAWVCLKGEKLYMTLINKPNWNKSQQASASRLGITVVVPCTISYSLPNPKK